MLAEKWKQLGLWLQKKKKNENKGIGGWSPTSKQESVKDMLKQNQTATSTKQQQQQQQQQDNTFSETFTPKSII